MRLYANSMSPFVRKVHIVLYEKGVEFETEEIDSGSQRSELDADVARYGARRELLELPSLSSLPEADHWAARSRLVARLRGTPF